MARIMASISVDGSRVSVMAFVVLALSIVFIVVAIVVLRLHPFLALVMASMLVGLLSPRPLAPGDAETPPAVLAVELTATSFGATAGSIGIVIVLAAIIGQCMMESGAADTVVRRLLAVFGAERASWSLFTSGYILSIPVFFDTVFFLLVPLARSLYLRTRRSYALYIIAISASAVVTHSLVPPTPGPLVMADSLSVDLGLAIGLGFLLGAPPAILGTFVYGRAVDRRLELPMRPIAGTGRAELAEPAQTAELPGLAVSVTPVLLPVLLIGGHSVAASLTGGSLLAWTGFFGNKNVALLLASFVAAWLLAVRKKLGLAGLAARLEPAVTSAGVIILITSAGGAFGAMLSRIGIDDAIGDLSSGGSGWLWIVLAWGTSSMMKTAQGSGTVAMITAAGMMAAVLPKADALSFHIIYIYAAIGFGSLFLSWMNDSGFWVVCKMSGLTERETFTVWSFVLVVMSIAGLIEVLLLSTLLPLT